MRGTLFAATLGFGAFLLFWIQPLTCRLHLPVLGGSPSVWNTCMVFYQALLLGGYAYADALARTLPHRRQVLVHLVVLGAGAGVLATVGAPRPAVPSGPLLSPSLWLMAQLAVEVGFPVFVLATTAPLLQRWVVAMPRGGVTDPYPLYAASNLGSFGALLLFPLVFEPSMGLRDQADAWAVGYGIYAALVAGCGIWSIRARKGTGEVEAGREGAAADPPAPSGDEIGSRGSGGPEGSPLSWVLCSLVPSSLLLGVTQYLAADVGSIPLLWIIPLALYLLSFVIVFLPAWNPARTAMAARVLVPMVISAIYLIFIRATGPLWLILVFHLGAFFVGALVAHGRLAGSRPPANRLTQFYLWLALGGVLGGLLNALVAPMLLRSVLEYPLMLVLVCALAPGRTLPRGAMIRRMWWALFLAVLMLMAVLYGWSGGGERGDPRAWLNLGMGVPLLFLFLLAVRPVWFVTGMLALLMAAWGPLNGGSRVVLQDRNFFGVNRVQRDAQGRMHQLVHGSTVHGRQWLAEADRCEPLSYYHREGPFPEVLEAWRAGGRTGRVGVVGLGAGAMAGHIRSGESWTFYEIDPLVIRIARDPRCFTYLESCAAEPPRIVEGDARVSLMREVPGAFSLLVLDAFSSDAIPVHLLTREALELYRSRLGPDGWLVVHISNRYYDLEPVLGRAARAMGWAMRSQAEERLNAQAIADGRDASTWAVMAPRKALLGELARRAYWREPSAEDRGRVWTDDYADVLGALKW